jgi:hypothetical protein
MVYRSLQGRPSEVNSHHSGPMAYTKHRRALYYLQRASEEARLCGSVALFGAYTLADQSFCFTTHGTTSTSQQLPIDVCRLHAISENTYSHACDESCSAQICSKPYREGPAHATTCTDRVRDLAKGSPVHPTALATPNNHTSKDKKDCGLRRTQEQKQVLTALFARCTKPATRTKHDLAKEFGVTRDKIDVSYVVLSERSLGFAEADCEEPVSKPKDNFETNNEEEATRRTRGFCVPIRESHDQQPSLSRHKPAHCRILCCKTRID